MTHQLTRRKFLKDLAGLVLAVSFPYVAEAQSATSQSSEDSIRKIFQIQYDAIPLPRSKVVEKDLPKKMADFSRTSEIEGLFVYDPSQQILFDIAKNPERYSTGGVRKEIVQIFQFSPSDSLTIAHTHPADYNRQIRELSTAQSIFEGQLSVTKEQIKALQENEPTKLSSYVNIKGEILTGKSDEMIKIAQSEQAEIESTLRDYESSLPFWRKLGSAEHSMWSMSLAMPSRKDFNTFYNLDDIAREASVITNGLRRSDSDKKPKRKKCVFQVYSPQRHCVLEFTQSEMSAADKMNSAYARFYHRVMDEFDPAQVRTEEQAERYMEKQIQVLQKETDNRVILRFEKKQ
jgi:hypothetical protein